MKKITSLFLSSVLFVSLFASIDANAYTYLDASTVKRLDADYKNYSGDKEKYINNKIAQINSLMAKEKNVTKKRMYLELKTYYVNKKEDLLDVDDVVDELFGTKVEYTPKYNIPDMPEAKSTYVTQSSYNNSTLEFRWTSVSDAEYYQIKFDNGSWNHNKAFTNHLRTVSCGKIVNAQVRACNDSGCSNPLYLKGTATNCSSNYYDYNYNNNYYNNYNNNNNNFQSFKDKIYNLYQKEIITQSEYNTAISNVNFYSDYTSVNSYYEGFARTAYYNGVTKWYEELKNRGILTNTEYNSKTSNVYNKMYIYNSNTEQMYNDAVSDVKMIAKAHILSFSDRLVNSGRITYSYRNDIVAKFDTIYNTRASFFSMFDASLNQLKSYDSYTGGTSDCSVDMNGVTYRLDSCSKSYSMRDGYGDQEFGFTVVSSDYNRSYNIEVSSEVIGMPYNAVYGGFTSGYTTGSRYITKYFSDSALSRGNYSGYVRIYITDNFGNKRELRQYVQLNNY